MSFLFDIEKDDLGRLGVLIVAATATLAEKATVEIAAKMKENAPVKTGFLRDNIYATVEDGEAMVKSDAEYSAYVEYGTSVSPAQPYIQPAVDDVNGALADMGRDLFFGAVR